MADALNVAVCGKVPLTVGKATNCKLPLLPAFTVPKDQLIKPLPPTTGLLLAVGVDAIYNQSAVVNDSTICTFVAAALPVF